MSESDAQAAAQKQRVLLALTKLRAEIDELRRAQREPIAIVGMSARFPGAPDADAFWDLLRLGGDGISEVPPDRWSLAELYDPDPDAVGKMYTRFGGFLQDIDLFDAAFFGISPREAVAMDPQHRMLLEAAWHALEDAGIAPDSLRDQPVGVYLGLCSADYGTRALGGDTSGLDAWFGQGISFSTAAGRVSFVLGTHGPSLSLDTACSSSLVAIDLACRSLREGQCSAALVGAASVILEPQGMINFCRGRVLSPDGRCKSFDAAGDGYVRSEGAAMVVLKRLSDATAAGDRILGVIRGTSVQHHGRSSSLTAPNGPAQERVMRDALHSADVDPTAVDYVEAHGTGTGLGDSIEFAAMARAYGPGRTAAHPLRIGCVKSNIGHTEGPAGLAGVIKVLHAFEHQALPPTIHLRQPSPLLDQPDPEIRIPRTLESWPHAERPRIAGVSAFSLSGTNAHVVVEEPPQDVDEDVPDGPGEPTDQVLVLSARSAASLVALKAKFRAWLADRPDSDWPSICFTAAVGRAHLPHRVAVVASSPSEAVTALDADTGHSGLLESGSAPRLAMIFAGQGTFCARDIRRLHDEHEVFRRTIDACEPLAGAGTAASLRDTIFSDVPDTRTDFARDAALFAIEVALYRLWEHWGVRPHAVIGHGLGEYVAAHVAGLLSLEDAFRLLRARAALLEPFAGRTASTLVFAPAIDISRLLGVRPDVSIAAINGPAMVVVSGERLAIDRACATLAAAGVHVSPLPESTAAHTGLVDDGLDGFEATIRGLASGEAQVRLVSGLTGTALSINQRCDTAYWRRQVREPVRFEAGVHTLATDWKCDTFVEIGPSGAFLGLARQSLPASREVAWIPSLTAQRPGARDLQEALGRLYVRGVLVDWQRVHAGSGRRRLRLPTYPFERRRYWLAQVSSSRDGSTAAAGLDSTVGPLPAAPPARPKEDGALMRVMSMTPAHQRLDLLRRLLKSRVVTLLGFESATALEDRRPLNEMGLNSLMALELKSELDRELGTVIPVAALFEHVTVEALARFLGRTYFDAADSEDLDQPLRSLRDEVALPEDIRVEGPSTSAADARSVLLTGATGYLGAYLLRSLITHTAATVHCLVRGQSPAAARERLLARQREIGEWDDGLAARITVVPGDLAEPRFGLDDAAYTLMAEAVDVVYHTAATVNFVLPYQALKRTIVGGTTEVLRFCAAGRPKPLHYVGTVAVLLSPGFQAADRLPEHEDLGDGSGLPMGYAQAKWVAEQLVLAARARGLSTTVYRPGFIGGHSRTGDCKLDDLIPRLAQGCVELGYAPDFGGSVMDFSPVDYVSEAVVHLSRRSEAAGGIFHLTHPSPTPWERFVDKMRERGYRLESLPFQDWLTRLHNLSEASALRGLVPFFEGVPSTLLRIPPAECARTQQTLNGVTLSCPDQTELLDRYLEYFWRIGWIPRPAGRV